MKNVERHINLLGYRVTDQVTGFKGVITSMSFDLFGCIQAVVNPGTDAHGKLQDSQWFDVNRLTILSPGPVMQQPNFDDGYQAEGKQGSADKPRQGQQL